MSKCVFNTTIQFRRDSTANWFANQDVVPAAGEPCFDFETQTLKIGDGKTKYADLKIYFSNKNIVSKLKLAGIDLPVALDQSVDIPLATNGSAGVVSGSDEDNKISVLEDGTMQVNSLSIDRLISAADMEIVFGGGGAN